MDSDASMGTFSIGKGGENNDGEERRGGRGRGRGRGGRGDGGNGRGRPGLKDTSTAFRRNPRGRGRVLRGRGTGRPIRQDADGDTSMGGNASTAQQRRPVAGVWLTVKGFPQGMTAPQLIAFLKEKANSPNTPEPLETVAEAGRINLRYPNSGAAFVIQKLHGVYYQGNKLSIIFAPRAKQMHANPVNVNLEERYNKEAKYLNLSGLSAAQNADLNSSVWMRNLFQAMANTCPEVATLNFAGNGITTLKPFMHLTKYLHSILNLSFDNNMLENFNELNNLKSLKNLREIVLTNNPLSSNQNYRREVMQRFPTLKFLDASPIEPLINFGLANLPPIAGNLYDTPQTQQLVEHFLQKYFALFDQEKKDSLIDVYTDKSMFTMSATINNRTKQKLYKNAGKNAAADFYRNNNRNFQTVKDQKRRDTFVHTGRVDIIHFMNSMPLTKHKPEDLRVDAFVMQNLGQPILTIQIHGSFVEPATSTSRSYDRTFLLSPAAPNSTAATQGWPAVILNEQLHVRDHETQMPAPSPPNSGPNVPGSPASNIVANPITSPPVLNPTLEPMKQQMVEKLMLATKLKPMFAKQCLDENGWNFDKAVEVFMTLQSRGALRPDMLDQ
eukprot:TRINITY_DN4725_c0_g1_i1.p1 TRINITY_DN4725_c0_g1~~TRINITY_DN4725_c0_g1_i1.p1  ORF type:complete len:612 (+),score=142.05 TRINITY_DN4725_c0_g1_i1:148-1983(+)